MEKQNNILNQSTRNSDPAEGKALIIGGGEYAATLAQAFLKENIRPVILAPPEHPARAGARTAFDFAETIFGEALFCHGGAGRFTISIDSAGKKKSLCASVVILAKETRRLPLFESHGIKENPRAISLSAAVSDSGRLADAENIVFMVGLKQESDPVIFEEIADICLDLLPPSDDLPPPKKKIYIFAGNLKVAENHLESLYRQTRRQGAVYFKFTKNPPKISQGADGRVLFQGVDESTRLPFVISPDMTVVDEMIVPSPDFKALSRRMGLEMDENGFIQGDNVHRFSVRTNRKGIFAAGPARKIQGADGDARDAALALSHSRRVIQRMASDSKNRENDGPTAEINPGSCVFCLTCLRSCPHGAVELAPNPTIIKEACEGCGACRSLCPGNAISMTGLDEGAADSKIKETRLNPPDHLPVIASFCCARSGAAALESALAAGQPLPRGLALITLPCAAAISVESIYSAFKNGADGVLILSCHDGNCHSGKGHALARERADYAADFFKKIKMDPKRIKTASLASNMAGAGLKILTDFEQFLMTAGRFSNQKKQ